MYNPYGGQYGPYYGRPQFNPLLEERRNISRVSNGLGFASLLFVVSITVWNVLTVGFLNLVGYNSHGWYAEFSGLHPVLYYLNTGVIYCLSLLIPFGLLLKIRRIPVSAALPFQKTKPLSAICYVLFGASICLLANIPANIVSSLLQQFGFSGTLPSEPETDILGAKILYAITIAVIPPLFEEFAFRGVVLSSLRKYGDWFAIVCSSVLFALFHGNFIQIPFAFLSGLVLGLAVVRTNNLWTSVAIHFLNNGFAVFQEFLMPYVSVHRGKVSGYELLQSPSNFQSDMVTRRLPHNLQRQRKPIRQ